MSQSMLDPQDPIVGLLERDTRYKFDAYVFVFEALRYAQDRLDLGRSYSEEAEDADSREGFDELDELLEDEPSEAERHVSGQELCEAIRLFALEQYGLVAKNVLDHWGIRATADFGELVFNLIDIGKMRKTEHDRREDFDNVYDFDEAFRQGFEITMPDSSKGRKA